MTKSTSRMSIGRKIFLIAASFALPIGVLTYLMVVNINSSIDFAAQELRGNAYQRHLEELLRLVQGHQLNNLAVAVTEVSKSIQGKIGASFEGLIDEDRRLGAALQFTEEGLTKRNRLHAQAKNVHDEWQALAKALSKANPGRENADKQYDHLAGDLKTMITHAGDTSNLILDPDLDSYYLMDVTLLALPQTQDRLARVARFGHDVLARGKATQEERVQMAVHGAMLQESDLDRITASTETSFNEDANFFGISPTLQGNLKPALAKYQDAAKKFIALTQQVAAADGAAVSAVNFLKAGIAAREASFEYWNVAVGELDRLLQHRVRDFESKRAWSLGMAALAVLAASLMAFFLMQSIAKPLGGLVKSLAPGADLLGVCAERIAVTSRSKTANPQDAEVICEELQAHCNDMRSAVAELVAQVHGTQPQPPTVQ